jgi:hypothetical protein
MTVAWCDNPLASVGAARVKGAWWGPPGLNIENGQGRSIVRLILLLGPSVTQETGKPVSRAGEAAVSPPLRRRMKPSIACMTIQQLSPVMIIGLYLPQARETHES